MPSKQTLTDYDPVMPVRRARGAAGDERAEDIWPVRDALADNAGGAEDDAAAAGKESESQTRATTATAAATTPAKVPALKRGHTLSYLGLFLFTAVLYFRPYELIPSLAGVTSMAFWLAVPTLLVFMVSQFALEGNLTARTREVHLALLLLVAGLLSMPFAIAPGEAWDEFNHAFWKAVMMFIVILNVVRTERRLKGLIFLGLAVGCMLSVGAINDYRAGRFVIEGQRVAGVVGGMFGNPNDLALHLVTMIPLAFGLFLHTRRVLAKPLYIACMLLMVGGVIATFSRGGFLGLMGAGTVLAWKLGRRNRALVIVLLVGLFVAFVALAPGEYASRLGSITTAADASSHSRRELLIRSIVVALRHPLFGVGMGNFHIVAIGESVSHNAYTQVASEMGMAAMIIYIMFIVVPVRRLRLIELETYDARRTSRVYYLSVAMQASIIAYMISSFFGSVAFQYYVYYLVGYAVALRRIYEAQTGREVTPPPKQSRRFDESERHAGSSQEFPEPDSRAAIKI
ncbi:MAG TPA: O-antigen ligase family protein [Pyrinomonadaceae bacterium]|jgi:O-antigen ligase|nr:O-antigen ligase family protein [Pyrinomonadaceae bacterium]